MERIYSEGKKYFDDLIQAIETAQSSVHIEMYIFEDDDLGRRVFEALERAAARGVDVRLIVDGIGSRRWTFKRYGDKTAVQVRVFRPLPWPFSRFYLPMLFHILYAIKLFWYVNRRTHKKLIIIDDKKVFLGSFNVFNEALYWKELGVQIEGGDLSEIKASFLHSWNIARPHPRFSNLRQKRRLYLEYKNSHKIWTNFKLSDRRHNNARLQELIVDSRQRVWLSQGYFLPTIGILQALLSTASRGVDVRLVQSKDSDVRLVRWANLYYYKKLLESGVKIYEYLPSILHSKIVLIDNTVKLGSSNLDHRSPSRDLELDIWLESSKSVKEVEKVFEENFQNSEWVDPKSFKSIGLFKTLRARIILLFKGWL